MQLSRLLGLPPAEFDARAKVKDTEISEVYDDSRQVTPGSVFVFDVRNNPQNAAAFFADAHAKGAICVGNFEDEKVIFAAEPGKILARWGKICVPNQPPFVVGVTGTNGKTSVAWFYQHLAAAPGAPAASVGTLGVVQNSQIGAYTGYTSPTAMQAHKLLHHLHAQGVQRVCMEVSSHALALHRLDGVAFAAAALTNITQDHLDFHGTMDAYVEAKQRLFVELLPQTSGAPAILNMNAPASLPLAAGCRGVGLQVVTVGTANAELVVAVDAAGPDGLDVTVKYAHYRWQGRLPLVGAFQAENVAVALGLCLASNVPWPQLEAKLATLPPVPGRMEPVWPTLSVQTNTVTPPLPSVIVDYAHTPDALERALEAARVALNGQAAPGKLWVVFGCGGNRDAGKRPLMGKLAAELADVSIITDDNPRNEDPAVIRAQIAQNAAHEHIIGNRAKAIAYAIAQAAPADVVLIAGKGHEQGQIIAGTTHPFDDRTEARKALDARLSAAAKQNNAEKL